MTRREWIQHAIDGALSAFLVVIVLFVVVRICYALAF